MSNFWWDLEGKLFILWPALVVLGVGLDYLWSHRRNPGKVLHDLKRLYWTAYDRIKPPEEKVFVIKVKRKGTDTALSGREGPCLKENKN